MTAQPNGDLLSDPFTYATRVRIAQLAPTDVRDSAFSDYIEAVVALIWPYSSSTKALSLLLAEPNVRLRKGKGQVKVTFHGGSAQEIANSHVGIGDLVRLRLSDAKWTQTGDVVSTPGKKVDWDLEYKQRVVLDVNRNGERLGSVDFEGVHTPPPINGTLGTLPAVSSRTVSGDGRDLSIRLSSHVTVKAKRVSSGSFLDASLDPFADDDGFVVGKGRKRTKFARHSGSWKLLDDGDSASSPPSPSREQPKEKFSTPEVIALEDTHSPESVLPEVAEEMPSLMPPPKTPIRRPPGPIPGISTAEENLTTPRLHPLASPGLPLVSPLIKAPGLMGDYFGQQQAPSELDAISHSPSSPATESFSVTSYNRGPISAENSPVDVETVKDLDSSGLHAHPFEPAQSPSRPSIPRASFPGLLNVSQEIYSNMVDTVDLTSPDEELSQQKSQTDISAVVHQSIQHEDDEEDIYGASEVLSRPEEAHLSRQRPQTQGSRWEDELDVVAVGPKTGNSISAPSFPNRQGLDEQKSSRRSSQQSSFLDGASDEVSESESMETRSVEAPLEDLPPRGISGMQEFMDLQHREIAEISLKPSHQILEVVEDEEVQISSQFLPDQAHSLDRLSMEGTHNLKQAMANLGPEALVETPASIPIEEADHPRNQLITPDNTQQDPDATIGSEVFAETLENRMPPTPENTQEPGVLDPPQADGPFELEFIRHEHTAAAVVPTTETNQPSQPALSPRFSRKSLNLQGISSPYFTPRRSTRITPDLQSPTFNKQQAAPSVDEKVETRRVLRSQVAETAGLGPTANGVVPAKPEPVVGRGLSGGLSTPLAYYVPLSHLSEHYNQEVDVLAICTSDSGKVVRAKAGPKDYYATLNTVDSSLTGNLTITAQLFRPYEEALPKVQRGDVVLLRAMRVQSQKRKCMLLSTGSSAWAVYLGPPVQGRGGDTLGLQIKTPGPPVEYGEEEINYARDLMGWWESEGSTAHPLSTAEKGKSKVQEEPEIEATNDVPEAETNALPVVSEVEESPQSNGDIVETTRVTRASRRAANRKGHPKNDDDTIEAPAPLSSAPHASRTSPRLRRHSRSISAVSVASSDLPPKAPRSENIVHELRDGTRYVDEQASAKEETRRRKEGSVVHELRDGVRWVDE